MKLLTIIIPTYNRCEYVEENLLNIVSQVIEYQDKIDVLITDNASTDGTDKMVRAFQNDYPNIIKYYKHESNIGASKNFDFGVCYAESEYVYLLGDDDLISPNFACVIFDLIKNYPKVGLIHFNYLMCSPNMNDLSLLYTSAKKKELISFYKSGKDFIPDFFNGPSFMSSNVFMKDLWLNGRPYLKDDCPGYEWFSILLYGSLSYPCLFYYLPIAIQRFTGVNNYAKKWAIYSLLGISKLFKYLDNEIPQLYEKWEEKKQKKEWVSFYQDIGLVYVDRTYYKSRFNEIRPFVGGKANQFILFCCVFVFPSWFLKKVYINIIRILNVLHKYF